MEKQCRRPKQNTNCTRGSAHKCYRYCKRLESAWPKVLDITSAYFPIANAVTHPTSYVRPLVTRSEKRLAGKFYFQRYTPFFVQFPDKYHVPPFASKQTVHKSAIDNSRHRAKIGADCFEHYADTSLCWPRQAAQHGVDRDGCDCQRWCRQTLFRVVKILTVVCRV